LRLDPVQVLLSTERDRKVCEQFAYQGRVNGDEVSRFVPNVVLNVRLRRGAVNRSGVRQHFADGAKPNAGSRACPGARARTRSGPSTGTRTCSGTSACSGTGTGTSPRACARTSAGSRTRSERRREA
jgi:hypothetical protein